MPSFVWSGRRVGDVFSSARLISALTLLSRVLGMARDILTSHFLGAGLVWDAFALANRVPNLFRRLFGEGALTAAFVPAFVKRLEAGKRDEAFLLLRRLATALTLLLTAVVGIGIAVTYLFPADGKSRLEGEFLRIMLPYLALICVGAILGAALNGLKHFFAPAFAPVIANVVSIATILAFAGLAAEPLGRMLAWSVLVGGVLQLVTMGAVLVARGASLAPDPALGDPALREVGRQFAPLVLGLSFVQINEFLNTVIAKLCVAGDGAVSALYYGNQLTQFPLSLVGVAVATAAFPALAASAAGKRWPEFTELLDKSMRGTVYLSVPATVGLVVFAEPILQLIFEHGQFGPEATARAAAVMTYYSLSLAFYCANQVQVRAFYAMDDTKTPVRVSSSMVVLTLALALALVRPMGEAGISLATSIGGLVSFVALQALLRRRVEVRGGALARTFALSLAAALVMAGAAWLLRRHLPSIPRLGLTLDRAYRVGVPIVAAIAVYFGLTLALRMPEARRFLRR